MLSPSSEVSEPRPPFRKSAPEAPVSVEAGHYFQGRMGKGFWNRLDEVGLLRMGPQSAGADPGPACYSLGGTEPTCSDADLVLGYLDPDFFAGGKIRLDLAAARAAVEALPIQ